MLSHALNVIVVNTKGFTSHKPHVDNRVFYKCTLINETMVVRMYGVNDHKGCSWVRLFPNIVKGGRQTLSPIIYRAQKQIGVIGVCNTCCCLE